MDSALKTVQEPIIIEGKAKVSSIIEFNSVVTALQYTELFDHLFVGFDDGTIIVLKDDQIAMTLKDADVEKSKPAITGMKHHPVSPNYPVTNTLTCTYKNGLVKFWNYNFQLCSTTLEEQRSTNGIEFHHKLAKFVTLGEDHKLYLYDEDSKRQERVFSASDEKNATNGHTGPVTCAAFHPKNVTELVSAGLDNTVQFWDTRHPNATRNIQGVTIVGDGIDISQKGTELLTCGSPKGAIRIWDYGSGKLIKTVELDKFTDTPLKCGKFCSKSHAICGGGPQNILRIFDVVEYKQEALITKIMAPVNSIAMDKKSGGPVPNFIFSAGKRIYYVSPK